MRPLINKETVMCMSLAARPGNFGTRFHNFLYEELGLDYLYKAFRTQDIVGAIAGVRALNIRGCAISMPFKEACIPLVDELDPSAQAIDSSMAEPPSLLALAREMRDPEVRRGLGRTLSVLRTVGAEQPVTAPEKE